MVTASECSTQAASDHGEVSNTTRVINLWFYASAGRVFTKSKRIPLWPFRDVRIKYHLTFCKYSECFMRKTKQYSSKATQFQECMFNWKKMSMLEMVSKINIIIIGILELYVQHEKKVHQCSLMKHSRHEYDFPRQTELKVTTFLITVHY